MNDGVEWGTVAQWAAVVVTLTLALWAVKRSGDKEALDALSAKIDVNHQGLREDIAALRRDDARAFERIDDIEADVAGVKANVAHLPTTDDVHAIALEQAKQGEMLKSINRVCESLAGSVKAIEQALIQKERE